MPVRRRPARSAPPPQSTVAPSPSRVDPPWESVTTRHPGAASPAGKPMIAIAPSTPRLASNLWATPFVRLARPLERAHDRGPLLAAPAPILVPHGRGVFRIPQGPKGSLSRTDTLRGRPRATSRQGHVCSRFVHATMLRAGSPSSTAARREPTRAGRTSAPLGRRPTALPLCAP